MNMLNIDFVIPNYIMELEDKHFSGEKVAAILEYQDISNVDVLLLQ